MNTSSYLIPTTRLCLHTELKAKVSNFTPCSSTFEILKRNQLLKIYLHLLKCVDIDELFLILCDNRVFETVVENHSELYLVTKALQRESVTIWKARTRFNTVIKVLPPLRRWLDKDVNMAYEKNS